MDIKRYVHGINLSCAYYMINKADERNAFCNSKARSTQDLKSILQRIIYQVV